MGARGKIPGSRWDRGTGFRSRVTAPFGLPQRSQYLFGWFARSLKEGAPVPLNGFGFTNQCLFVGFLARKRVARKDGRVIRFGIGATRVLVKCCCGVCLLLTAAAAGWGCGSDRPVLPTGTKLLVIGIDSADWTLVDPMLAGGRLPHLQAFKAQATSGRMLSFRPLQKSPVLWASILTGLPPDQHGVGGFVEGEDQTPVRGSAWKAPALWDIAGAAGFSTAVLGMWTTYPARDILGVMVSDYLPYDAGREAPRAGLVSPESLATTVAGLRIDPASLTPEDLSRFFPPGLVARCVSEYPDHYADLLNVYAADLSYLAVARWLAAHDTFDIFFFYLRGPDMISHKFWRFFEPVKSPVQLSQDEIEVLGQIVPLYYEWVDEVVGEVLGWFPPDTPAVILSDHGFHGPRKGKARLRLGTQEHNPFGVFLVRSPFYEPGGWFDRMELLDINPTFLALLGLPPSAEMPGKILATGMTRLGERWLSRLERQRIASYQHLTPTRTLAGEEDAEVDETIREQLRSLGYIK